MALMAALALAVCRELDIESSLGDRELEGRHAACVDPEPVCCGRPQRHLCPALGGLAAQTEFLEQPREVGFVECAGDTDEVAEVPHGPVAVAGEPFGGLRVLPAAGCQEPSG